MTQPSFITESPAGLQAAVLGAFECVDAPRVCDLVLEEALAELGESQVPRDAARFAAFVDGPLRRAAFRALGPEMAEPVLRELERIAHHASCSTVPAAHRCRAGGRRAPRPSIDARSSGARWIRRVRTEPAGPVAPPPTLRPDPVRPRAIVLTSDSTLVQRLAARMGETDVVQAWDVRAFSTLVASSERCALVVVDIAYAPVSAASVAELEALVPPTTEIVLLRDGPPVWRGDPRWRVCSPAELVGDVSRPSRV